MQGSAHLSLGLVDREKAGDAASIVTALIKRIMTKTGIVTARAPFRWRSRECGAPSRIVAVSGHTYGFTLARRLQRLFSRKARQRCDKASDRNRPLHREPLPAKEGDGHARDCRERLGPGAGDADENGHKEQGKDHVEAEAG